MHNIETSNVLLPMYDHTCSSHVTPTSDDNNIPCIKLDKIGDFVLFEIELDSVVNFDQGVGVTDRAAVMGDDMGNTF